MYKAKLWDEDKWNIHSNSYNSSKYTNIFSDDKKEDIKYHEQKYGQSEKSLSSDYIRKEEQGDKEENKAEGIFEHLEEEKNERQDIKEEEIPFKAAKQVFGEGGYETKKTEVRKDTKTIEDAIKKAIEEEKKVIIMDS
mgnify:CR=1 FL=1